MALNRAKAKAAGYTDSEIDAYLKAKEFSSQQAPEEPEEKDQGALGFLKSAAGAAARPFTETAKRVGEAGYQTYLTALPGGPEDIGSREQQARVNKPTMFMNQEQLADRGNIIEGAGRSTAGLGAYAVPAAKISALGAIIKGGVAGGGLTAAQPETGAGDIAAGAAGGALTAGAFKYLPKAARPFKSAGRAREAAVAQSNATVSGDKIIADLTSKSRTVSPTQQSSYNKFLETAKAQYGGKEIPLDQSLTIQSEANKAYTAAGKVGKSATATFNKTLGDAIRGELKEKAPDVAKANQLFSRLYKGQGIAKGAIRPAAGAAATAVLFKLLGFGGL